MQGCKIIDYGSIDNQSITENIKNIMEEKTKIKIRETLLKKYKDGILVSNMSGAHSQESRKKQSYKLKIFR